MATLDKAEFEATIIAACNKHQREHWEDKDYRNCISIDGYFIKFGDYETLRPEIQTQLHVATYAESLIDTSRPRIAKVLHYFETKKEEAYLVMERIELIHSPLDLPRRMLEAITWLATVPAPNGHVLGLLGGGRIRHSFFKKYTAPFHFQSVQALERYVNQGCTILQSQCRHREDHISITNERLIFTQPDVHDSNFGVDEEGKTVLLDFGEVALLPESFARFTLSSKEEFSPIIESLGLSGESNMALIGKIAYALAMVSDPKLGLDANSFSVTSKKR
ncbi:hypothetical protein EDD16DRAFT_1758372 [Pisolithus croceorrhizus]|nr:hypothetical protein EDD16DRAFT_1758372 [Pisolithus croceorrhizus]